MRIFVRLKSELSEETRSEGFGESFFEDGLLLYLHYERNVRTVIPP